MPGSRSCWTKAGTGTSGACWPREGVAVLRLIRVAIGRLRLGDLPRGQWRWLDADDLARLARMGSEVAEMDRSPSVG